MRGCAVLYAKGPETSGGGQCPGAAARFCEGGHFGGLPTRGRRGGSIMGGDIVAMRGCAIL
jgi:hypothetical protein